MMTTSFHFIAMVILLQLPNFLSYQLTLKIQPQQSWWGPPFQGDCDKLINSRRRRPWSTIHGETTSYRCNAGNNHASDIDTDDSESLKDKEAFFTFFNKKTGANNNVEMTKIQFLDHPEVKGLLDKGAIYLDDLEDMWNSSTADAAGLDKQEAYEMLCMVRDLPDPEDEQFLDDEFEKLTASPSSKSRRSKRSTSQQQDKEKEKDSSKVGLSYLSFLNWGDVQDIINEEVLTLEEVTDIWRQIVGDLDAKVDRTVFGRLNRALDDAIEAKDDEEDDGGESQPDENAVDDTRVDPWALNFDPVKVFSEESLQEIRDYFDSVTQAQEQKAFSFLDLTSWPDIKELIAEGELTKEALATAWQESVSFLNAKAGRSTAAELGVDFDTFLRLNVRLDLLMDDIEASKAEQQPNEGLAGDSAAGDEADFDSAESYYRSEFRQLTDGRRLLRLDMLLQWTEVADLVKDGVLTEALVGRIFEGLPKEPMGIPSTAVGIAEEAFVSFNNMLDVLLDSKSEKDKSQAAATPLQLISEPPRPMPAKDKELSIGSLGATAAAAPSTEDDSSTGLSGAELELMELLDKADNMLNSGSYGDFDQLIGDLNDPRLSALREKRDGAEEVRGALQEIVQELLTVGRRQGRCGLDKPSEEEAARIRDLVQAVIEKSPKLATVKTVPEIRKQLNGKWKLLYSNSEMLDFYNGVTGFANVFPTSKFKDLSFEYFSDGYASDAKYFETLSSSLGDINAVVYANWDLVKEMSFMTNENSVVLRNYCVKVTAGPMEYEAQENWKSLRTMSMNEIVYIDDRIKIARNCGALRIYFLYERI